MGNLRQDLTDRFFYLQQSGNDLAQLLQYVQRRLYFSPSLCYNYGITWYELWDSDDGDYYGWVDENYIDFY